MRLNFWKKESVETYPNVEHAVAQDQQEQDDLKDYPKSGPFRFNLTETQDMVSDNLYNKIGRWILYVGIGLLPLFFTPFTTGQLELNKQLLLIVFASASLILWLVGIVSSSYLSWRPDRLTKPVLAFAGATLLATVFSITRFKSLFGLTNSLSNSFVSIFALSIVYLLIINLVDDKGKKIHVILAGSLLLTFLYGILQLFGIYLVPLSLTKFKMFNSVGSFNSLGILAAVGLPFLYKLKLNFPWVNLLPRVTMVLGLALLFILNWWVLWTVVVVGMFGLVVLESLNSRGFKVSSSIVPLVIIVLGFFMMIVNINWLSVKKGLPVEIAPSYRLSSKIGQSVLGEKLILGYGPENFSLAFDKYGSSVLANTALSTAKFYDATSELLTTLVHGGVVLFLAVLFLLGYAIWLILRYRLSESDERESGNGTLAMLIALLAAFCLYPFNLTLMFVLYVTLALVSLTLWGNEKRNFSIEQNPLLSLVASLGFIFGLIIVLLGSYFGVLAYMSDLKYAQALQEKDFQKAVDTLTEAVKWNNNDDRYYRSLSQVALNLLNVEINKPNTSPQKASRIQNYTTSAINFARKATEVGPRETLNWSNLGNVYQNLFTLVENVDKLAEDAYLKATEYKPGDATNYSKIGVLYLTKGDLLEQLALRGGANASKFNQEANLSYAKAEDAFKKAVDVSNNFGLAIYNLGVVYDREGKVNEAIKQLERLAPANANQAGLMFELGLLYYRAGRKDAALAQLQRAIILAPDYANARWYLALIYEEKNDLPAAVEQLEKILSVDINKDNPVLLSKLKDLQNGKKSIPPAKVLDQKPL